MEENGRPTLAETMRDHEQRIRSLEKWRYAIPASLIIALGSGAALIIRAL